MVFKRFDSLTAQRIMDFCDKNNIYYELWNAESIVLGSGCYTEIGLNSADWIKVDGYLSGMISQTYSLTMSDLQ